MGCLFYSQKQTSVCYVTDRDVIARYGGAKLVDKLPCHHIRERQLIFPIAMQNRKAPQAEFAL
jgi:hypothetical protein